MRAETGTAQVQLAAWRDTGADRLDPVRFRFIEALAERAAGRDGKVRELLDARLAGLLAAYAADLAQAGPGEVADTRMPSLAGGPLAPLLGCMAAQRATQDGDDPLRLPALAEFRQLWGELLGERRLRQSMAPQPADAGPLNSGVLVHRAIAHMRAASPDYLRHFLSYADHLCWLERLHQATVPAAPVPGGTGRRTAPRKRKA